MTTDDPKMSFNSFNLSRRVTHKYRDGWANEDLWEDIGIATGLSQSYFMANDLAAHDGRDAEYDMCEPMTQVFLVRVDKPLTDFMTLRAEFETLPASLRLAPAIIDTHVKRKRADLLAKVRESLEHSMSGSSCHHEHDCCGCRSYRATAYHLSEDLWTVLVRSSRNY